MNYRHALACAALLALLATGPASAAAAEVSPAGLWDARVQVGALEVPFRFEIALEGAEVSGWFFNGRERVRSSSGNFEGGHLVLNFDSYARRLDVTLGADGRLAGEYGPSLPVSTAAPYPFHATRASARDPAGPTGRAPGAASIAGLWIVPADSRKAGERAWRFIVRQHGAEVSAAILRVDGDSGALTGEWQDGHLVLSHFDGARPALIDVEPARDGTLALRMHAPDGADRSLIAYRPRDATRQGLPSAADPTHHTGVEDRAVPFQFRFPDLRGRLVANTDPRFRGKVLVVDVMGSWCPNCHDEAPLLQALYQKYRDRGLEVVTLAFEEPEQLADPVRLRAFVRDFGLGYTVLLAGSPQELHEKLPQATGLDAYPTTFFVGRDGRVRGVHAGFAAPATGEFNVRLKQEFTATIERLLAEKG
jgi:thiol-disulfide isomerase/thioredoxin